MANCRSLDTPPAKGWQLLSGSANQAVPALLRKTLNAPGSGGRRHHGRFAA